MFVVIFQMLYLLGKYVYDNYRVRKANSPSSDAAEGETADHPHVFNDNRVQVEIDDTEFLPLAELSQTVKFSPPAYIQRYLAVMNVLSDPKYERKLRKIVDFGCSELGFLPYLKNVEGVEEILLVDVDRSVLLLNKAKAMPLVSDHFQHRQRPLKIEICVGSVIHNDKKLEKTDAVVCIELIEHLYDHVLFTIPINIFQYIRPKIVVITTPNVEFNVLFPNLAGAFRHPDHKFEWTRRQFQSWAENIVRKYPYYSVRFQGICYGPEGTKHLGACTQMAIFERNQEPNTIRLEGVEGFFETIDTYVYPFIADERTDSRKVLDDVLYYVNFLANKNEESPNVVYLAEVMTLMTKYSVSLEILKDIMCEHGYVIEERENGPAVILPDESEYEADEIYVDDSEYDDQLLDFLSTDEEQSVEDYSTNVDAEYESENWNESIIIVESQAVPNQENSYLFDGEHSADHHHSSEELAAAPDIDARLSRINNIGLVEQEVSQNAAETNDLAEPDDSVAMYNTIKSGLPVTLENVDMNLSSVQDNDDAIAIFQPYLSVSRSSTSPGLLFNSEMDDSLISQNLLNSTFNKSEVTNKATTIVKLAAETSSIETLLEEKDEIDFSDHSPPSSLEVNYSSNIELDDVQSSANQISKDCNLAETELQISFSDIYDEPQSTSSPRKPYINSSKKVHTTHSTKRSCLEGDDLITALESYTELNPPETFKQVVSDTDALEGTSQELSFSDVTGTTDPFQATSDRKNATSKRKTDANCSFSNNSQRELCLGNNKSCSDQSTLVNSLQEDCSEEIAEVENLIKHETDIVDVQRIDRVLSSDDEHEEYACRGSKVAATKPHNDDTETCLRNGRSEDLAHASVSGENLNLFQDALNNKSWNSSDECSSSSVCAKENNDLVDSFKSCDEEDTSNKVVQFASPLKSDESVGCDTKDSTSKDVNTSNIAGLISSAEAKPPSPPSFESPPDSWSHEIMDSGYPNSASGQDITPENDLSSIAQDHIADTESPSVAEAPRLGVLEPVEVENGDLANNNRDDEGNNMMAADANDIEGLQPLIDVLENDLENENDIYVLENGFPMWLLRILDMANPLDFDVQPRQNLRVHREVADIHYMDHDEGFDSSSSDE